MSRLPRQKRLPRRNRTRQVCIVLASAGVFAVAALQIAGYATAKPKPAVAADAQGDEEIYTGSILYMPDEGDVCRQILFDNHNGRFTDNGYVDCEQAAYQGSSDAPRQWSAARLRVISSGFASH
jgi:hypothetical protein